MSKSHIVLIALLTAVTFGVAGCSHVAEDWKAAQAANTPEAYQDFLRQHPDSEFASPAQERVKQLAEDRDWQTAQKTDTLDAYQQFVATHADGKWAQEARVRIENFQLTAGAGAQPALGAAAGAGAGAETADSADTVRPAVPAKPVAAIKPVAAARPAHSSKAMVAPKHVKSTQSTSSHVAQLGAYGSKSSAEAAWHHISERFPAQLKSLQPHYVTAKRLHSKAVVRLQVRLSSAQRTHELCTALKMKSQACVPVG